MKFEIYEDRSGQYRWILLASDGQLVASSLDSYAYLDDARHAIVALQASISMARIVDGRTVADRRSL